MPTINEKTKNLYIAINNVVSEIGKEGQIDSRHKLTEELMHALFDIDGGEYKPELLDTPDAELTKDAEPVLKVDMSNWPPIDFLGKLRHQLAPIDGMYLYTHPPAPKAITAEDVTDEVVDAVEDAIGMGRGAWDMVDHKELIAATCKTIGQAPIALALLTIDEVRTAYINANNDGFDFEGQLQKAFCKKNGLPHPTE